jgi:hypothetical protein
MKRGKIMRSDYLLDMLDSAYVVYRDWRRFKTTMQPDIKGMRITVWLEDGTGKTIERGEVDLCPTLKT